MNLILILIISLIVWVIDFLSDSQITKDETKIGIIQYLHHLFSTIAFIGPFINLFFGSVPFYIISVLTSMIIQAGFLINNDYCWLSTLANKCIDPDHPNRKWRSAIDSFIKHYIRGDSWAYSEMCKPNFTYGTMTINCIFIIGIIKILIH